jgi:hypothetical protein
LPRLFTPTIPSSLRCPIMLPGAADCAVTPISFSLITAQSLTTIDSTASHLICNSIITTTNSTTDPFHLSQQAVLWPTLRAALTASFFNVLSNLLAALPYKTPFNARHAHFRSSPGDPHPRQRRQDQQC